MRALAALFVGTTLVLTSLLGLVVLTAGAATRGDATAGLAVAGIPADFLAAYRASSQRYGLGADGWSYLAGIGKVESNHGQSTAAGVHSGENAYGCCAGPMQINNAGGGGGGTWGAYRQDGDGDGRADIYSPADSVATAANYLRASGAPADWRAAVFAYNHAGWYVDEVFAAAAEYRRSATDVAQAPTGPISTRGWLADVPGFPGERCDRRIVADVVALTRAYGLRLTDCFGGFPHEPGGEHPLGLAADLTPVDGNWSRTERLARAAGWLPECAPSGCPGRGPFRVVLYNGFPGHGDPRFSSRPHLHLSWQHGPARPFSPASWVRTVLPSSDRLTP